MAQPASALANERPYDMPERLRIEAALPMAKQCCEASLSFVLTCVPVLDDLDVGSDPAANSRAALHSNALLEQLLEVDTPEELADAIT